MKTFLFILSFFCSFVSKNSYAYTAMALPGSLFSVNGEPKDGFSNKTDFGLSLLSGNTRSENLTAAELLSYRWEIETLQFQARYIESAAADLQTAQNWMLGVRYERKLISKLGFYAGESLEADRFAGLFQRYSTDLGLREKLFWNEVWKAAVEAGYRHQFENRLSGAESSEIARIFSEVSYQWTKTTNVIWAEEFLPTLGRARDWRLNSEIDLAVAIDKIFSLNVAYAFRFDNEPAATNLVKLDRMLLTTLSARF